MARPVYWTETEILNAIQRWTLRYGRPPRMIDWVSCLEPHPCTSTVLRRYGAWSTAIQAAQATS